MLFKNSNTFLAAILLIAVAPITFGQSIELTTADRIKARVIDIGPGSKVTVFLKDGTKVRGSIAQILDDSFDVTLMKQTQSSIISYRDVQEVKRRGWTSSAKVGLGIGIGSLVVIAAIVIIASS